METIHESPDLKVLYRPGEGDTSWVTFGAVEAEGAFAEPLIRKRGDTGVFFIPKREHWFQTADIFEALAKAERLTRTGRRIAYGSSKGGFAALAYGRELLPDLTIAAAPQVSVHPDDVGAFDTRWTHLGAGLAHGRRDAREGLHGRRVIILDPMERRDRTHAWMIGGETIPVRFAGHSVLHALKEAGTLSGLISGIVDDEPSQIAEALAKYKACRRDGILGRFALAERCQHHGRYAAALSLYQASRAVDEARVDFCMSQCLWALERGEEALLRARWAASANPTYRVQQGLSLVRIGRAQEALAKFDGWIDASPLDAELHAGRASALRALGRHDAAAAGFSRANDLAPGNVEWARQAAPRVDA